MTVSPASASVPNHERWHPCRQLATGRSVPCDPPPRRPGRRSPGIGMACLCTAWPLRPIPGGLSEESRLHRACAGQPGDSHQPGTRPPPAIRNPPPGRRGKRAKVGVESPPSPLPAQRRSNRPAPGHHRNRPCPPHRHADGRVSRAAPGCPCRGRATHNHHPVRLDRLPLPRRRSCKPLWGGKSAAGPSVHPAESDHCVALKGEGAHCR